MSELTRERIASMKGTKDIRIPYGVTSILDGAFQWFDSATSITIPDSVTSIGGGLSHGAVI